MVITLTASHHLQVRITGDMQRAEEAFQVIPHPNHNHHPPPPMLRAGQSEDIIVTSELDIRFIKGTSWDLAP